MAKRRTSEKVVCLITSNYFIQNMAKETHADQAFLEYLIKSIVNHPDDVKVERKVDEMGVLLSLKVHGEDMGMIIGRSGNTAKAIRSLLRIIGMKNNARVNLKIEEPEGGSRRPAGEGIDKAMEGIDL